MGQCSHQRGDKSSNAAPIYWQTPLRPAKYSSTVEVVRSLNLRGRVQMQCGLLY